MVSPCFDAAGYSTVGAFVKCTARETAPLEDGSYMELACGFVAPFLFRDVTKSRYTWLSNCTMTRRRESKASMDPRLRGACAGMTGALK